MRGANVHAQDFRKRTPLTGLLERNEDDCETTFEKATILMRASASIHAGDENGFTPLLHAFNRPTPQMRKLLTGSQNEWKFDGCSDIHKFYDHLFPHCRSVADYQFPDWIPSIEQLIPNLLQLNSSNGDEKQNPLAFPRDYRLAGGHQFVHNNVNSILKFLQNIPLFKQVWEGVNSKDPLQVVEEERDYPALYDSLNHIIYIDKSLDLRKKTACLAFEMMNAFQRGEFEKTRKLAALGDVSREEFVILIERIEYNSAIFMTLISQVLNLDVEGADATFNEQWETIQRVSEGRLIYHADDCRYDWDEKYSSPYLQKHPELFVGLEAAMTGAQIF